MEFTSKQQAKRQTLRAACISAQNQLKTLDQEIALEKEEFTASLKAQGWTEVSIPTYEAYGEHYSGLWILFAPTVPASVIETARSEGCCFEPEEAGLKPEEFYW